MKASSAAGHLCPDGCHQDCLNLSGFSNRPSKFHEICPDNWTGLQKSAKNLQKLPKKSPVNFLLDSLTIEQNGYTIKYELAKNRQLQ